MRRNVGAFFMVFVCLFCFLLYLVVFWPVVCFLDSAVFWVVTVPCDELFRWSIWWKCCRIHAHHFLHFCYRAHLCRFSRGNHGWRFTARIQVWEFPWDNILVHFSDFCSDFRVFWFSSRFQPDEFRDRSGHPRGVFACREDSSGDVLGIDFRHVGWIYGPEFWCMCVCVCVCVCVCYCRFVIKLLGL